LIGFRAAVLTVSDGVAAGTRVDTAGPAVAAILERAGYIVVRRDVCSDDQQLLKQRIAALCDEAQLVLTAGGTGVAERDVTPEATLAISQRVVPGLAELMRSKGGQTTAMAYLSRAVGVTYRKSLIVNLPGSEKGATESLRAVLPLLHHVLELLSGKTEHSPTT
jgi:molybdenum cofactor synthesis domain-containing protein